MYTPSLWLTDSGDAIKSPVLLTITIAHVIIWCLSSCPPLAPLPRAPFTVTVRRVNLCPSPDQYLLQCVCARAFAR